VTDLTQYRALAAAARAETGDGLTAREQLSDIVDELAGLLEHATDFAFDPDLDDLAYLVHFWRIRLESSVRNGLWTIVWANSRRPWSVKRGDWLSVAETAELDLWSGREGAPHLDEVRFRFAEALELVPQILEFQAAKAREVSDA
jgi:hypothetical protein